MLDGRIWPRAAAIAERLWSPAGVADAEDMYTRLRATSALLERLGLRHRSGPEAMLARLAGPDAQALKTLTTIASLLEPVKGYARSAARDYTQQTPLTRLVDAVPPESETAREVARIVESHLANPGEGRDRLGMLALAELLRDWREAAGAAAVNWTGDSPLAEAAPLARDLAGLAELGLCALESRPEQPLALSAADSTLLSRANQPTAELILMVGSPIRKLVDAAARPAAVDSR
jgi:hexosaminidase